VLSGSDITRETPAMSEGATFVSGARVSSSKVRRPGPSYAITDAAGRKIKIPATAAEDAVYFTVGQADEIRRYYAENGYVVVRGLIPRQLCGEVVRRFHAEVKPYPGFLYRHTSANPEKHVYTTHGFMLNPILNVQSLDRRRFPRFRETALELMTHPNAQAVAAALLGEPGTLVRSMYFEGNPSSWAHQDTYDLDAERIGGMTAAWLALEDIAPGAGRFYVYPKSHLVDMKMNGADFDPAFHRDRYKKLVIDVIRRNGLKCKAPALRQGDALFWSSRTMHGSLETTQPRHSRSSLTAHYIPGSSRLLRFQSRIRSLTLSRIGGINVHRPRNLSRATRRMMLWVETTFPGTVQAAKKLARKAVAR
jgi:phytanoyl-CoA hydroxylase